MKYYMQHIWSVLFSLVFLAVSGASLWFLSEQIVKNGNDLQEKMQVVANDEQFDKESESLMNLLADTEDERTQLTQFILNDEHDIIRLLSEIDNFAVAQGVDLNTSRLDTKKAEGDFNELLATFVVKGNERAVIHAVKTLESLPYHSDVTSLQFHRSIKNENGVQEVAATIALVFSIQKYD